MPDDVSVNCAIPNGAVGKLRMLTGTPDCATRSTSVPTECPMMTDFPHRRLIGIPTPAHRRFIGVFAPPKAEEPDQGPRFEAYVNKARGNLKTRRGVLLTCAKATPCRVPFYRMEGTRQIWPNAFWELRENLRAAEPAALNEVDNYAMWTQTDILRVARTVWEDFEESEFSHSREAILDARAREEHRNDARRARRRMAKEEERAKRASLREAQGRPGYVPLTKSSSDPLVSVDAWIEQGRPHLDDILPLRLLTKNQAHLMHYGPEAPARCNQITAGEFMQRCVGRTDVPLKGWSIFAAQALDRISGWTRCGKKRHRGSVAVVWRRDGATGEFTVVKETTARRRVM